MTRRGCHRTEPAAQHAPGPECRSGQSKERGAKRLGGAASSGQAPCALPAEIQVNARPCVQVSLQLIDCDTTSAPAVRIAEIKALPGRQSGTVQRPEPRARPAVQGMLCAVRRRRVLMLRRTSRAQAHRSSDARVLSLTRRLSGSQSHLSVLVNGVQELATSVQIHSTALCIFAFARFVGLAAPAHAILIRRIPSLPQQETPAGLAHSHDVFSLKDWLSSEHCAARIRSSNVRRCLVFAGAEHPHLVLRTPPTRQKVLNSTIGISGNHRRQREFR